MWMSWYLQDMLIRQQIAEAQGRAARDHLVRRARSPRPPSRVRERVWRLWRQCAQPEWALVPRMKGR